MWAFYSLVFVQFLFLSPFLESAIFPSFRRRLHKIRIRKKRNGRREQHLERSEENKSLVSLVLYVLRAALRILIYAFPLSSVPSFSTFLPAFSERTWPRQRKKEKKRRGSFSLFLSAWLISLQVSRAVYRAQSSVNYYGPEGGLLLIGLLTSCLLLSRRRFFFLSSLPCSLRFEERPEKLQGSLSLLGLLYLPLPRESNDSRSGLDGRFRIKQLLRHFVSTIYLRLDGYFFFPVCQNGALIFSLEKKETKREKDSKNTLKIQNSIVIVIFNSISWTEYKCSLRSEKGKIIYNVCPFYYLLKNSNISYKR